MNNLIDYSVVIKVNKKTTPVEVEAEEEAKKATSQLIRRCFLPSAIPNIDNFIGNLFPIRSSEVINNLLRCVNQWVGHVVARATKVVGVQSPKHHATQALLHRVHGLQVKRRNRQL